MDLISPVNDVEPVCCVATVYHQVRCMHRGHLGYFYRAISHLKWRKIVLMIYLVCTFIQMTFIDMFFVFFQSGVPRHSVGDLLRFEYITSLFSCLCISMLPSNSSGNMQKHGHLGCFHAAFARENVSWVWVIYSVYNKNYSNAVWVLMDLISPVSLLGV